jgi:hypothetical protein
LLDYWIDSNRSLPRSGRQAQRRWRFISSKPNVCRLICVPPSKGYVANSAGSGANENRHPSGWVRSAWRALGPTCAPCVQLCAMSALPGWRGWKSSKRGWRRPAGPDILFSEAGWWQPSALSSCCKLLCRKHLELRLQNADQKAVKY